MVMVRLSFRWLPACLLAASVAGLTVPPRRDAQLRARQERGEIAASGEEDTADAASGGVIHFLFLLNASLPNAQLWRRFFDEAPSPETYRVWVHCSDPGAEDRLPSWPELTVVPTVPSFYCGDLVSPMVQLARLASRGAGDMDKFVFLSDTTLPVKPFRDVRAALLQDRKSDFCVDAAHQWPIAHVDGDTYRLVKHEQWVILNYNHAKRFARRWNWSTDATKQKILLGSSGDRLASGKAVERKMFKPYRCSDEVMVFATIFGAPPESNHEVLTLLDVDALSVPRNLTTEFDADVETATAATDHLVYSGLGSLDTTKDQDYQGRCRTLVKFGPLDGRDPDRDLALRNVGRDHTSKVVSLGGSHPVEFSEVGEAGLVALRRSPFLFARKWPDDAERRSPLFSTVMSTAYRMPS